MEIWIVIFNQISITLKNFYFHLSDDFFFLLIFFRGFFLAFLRKIISFLYGKKAIKNMNRFLFYFRIEISFDRGNNFFLVIKITWGAVCKSSREDGCTLLYRVLCLLNSPFLEFLYFHPKPWPYSLALSQKSFFSPRMKNCIFKGKKKPNPNPFYKEKEFKIVFRKCIFLNRRYFIIKSARKQFVEKWILSDSEIL